MLETQRAMSEQSEANSGGLSLVAIAREHEQLVHGDQLDAKLEESKWLKFVRFYLNLGIKFRQGKDCSELTEPYVHLPIYSHLPQMFYIYFGLKLLASLVLQHNYNGLTWELQQHTSGGGGGGTNQTSSREHRRMKAELELTEDRINLIGNAFYEFGFTVEIFYLYIVYFTFIGYAQPLIYNSLHESATFNIVRDFVMPERDRKLFTNTDIAQQTSKFITSSRHFMLVQRKETCRTYQSILSEQASDKGRGAHRRFSTGSDHDHLLAERNVQLRQLELAHARSAREWAELTTSGNLTPLNRAPEHVEQLARYHIMLILHFGMGPFLLCCVLFLILPRLPAVAHLLHNRPRDLLFQAELIVYCFLSEYAWSFYPALIVLCTLDHIKCVGELRRMIGDLIVAAQNHTDRGGPRSSSGIVVHNLTPQVKRVLIHYKLLKEQILNNQTIIGFVSANTVMPVLVAPALARIYAAQLSAEMRHLYLGVCLIIIATIDTFLFPICYLHARCLELYRTMSNLLAHLDAVNHFRVVTNHTRRAQLRTVYIDEHTLWLLRRELHQPEFATRQFATDARFLRLTYSNLMGAHFYCGLWLVPMLMRNTSGLTSGTSALLGLL